jgi:predicted RNA-binding protein with RPS1 domain
VNKTISEKSDFSNYQLIDENAVKVIDAGGNEVSSNSLRTANDKWYFLVNLKEKQNSRKGGGKYTKNRLLRRLTQRKKTKRRRNKKRKSKKQH